MDSSKDNFFEKGITGNGLKLLAILSMLVDHTAVSLMLRDNKVDEMGFPMELVYISMRLVGRIAFPLFIFLLVEGYTKTHSKKRYMLRLLIFAIISEIPFDMALWVNPKEGGIIEFEYQNVFFTLAFGLFVIWITDFIFDRVKESKKAYLFVTMTVIVFGILALFIRADYGFFGVVAIFAAYILRMDRPRMIAVSCLILMLADVSELVGLVAIGPVLSYNGKRGRGNKWLFYAVYPIHLLVLGLIKML